MGTTGLSMDARSNGFVRVAVAALIPGLLLVGSLTGCAIELERTATDQDAATYAEKFIRLGSFERCEHQNLTMDDVNACQQGLKPSKPDNRPWKVIDTKSMFHNSWSVLLQDESEYQVVGVYQDSRDLWGVEGVEAATKSQVASGWECVVYPEWGSCREQTEHDQ